MEVREAQEETGVTAPWWATAGGLNILQVPAHIKRGAGAHPPHLNLVPAHRRPGATHPPQV